MDKNTIIRILVEKLENEIRNSLKENLHKNPMAGTPLEGMFLLQIINEECENYRNFLSQSQDKINVTQNEIDIIISTASKNISRQVFDNMDDEDDDSDFQNFNFQDDDFEDDDFEDDENENIENEKFIISSLFYKFCFSDEVAALFLNDDSHSDEIAQNIKNTTNLSDSASFLMFKAFLRRNNIQINQIDDDRFEYNNFEFDFNLTRRKIENSNNYFEILSNNIENVKNEDGIELAVANNFVIYIENNKPKILCSVINDPYINKYSIRRVQTNGISSSIGFITDNKISTICEKIKEIIPKKEIVKSVNSNPKLNEQFKNYKEGLMSLIGDKNPAKGSDDNKTISFYLGLANKNKAFDFYELVRTNNNGAYFRIHTMNGFSTIAETTSEVIYNDLSKTEWFDLIYKTSMKHFFKEEVKLFKSGYVKQKSGGCLGMIVGLSFILYFTFSILTK